MRRGYTASPPPTHTHLCRCESLLVGPQIEEVCGRVSAQRRRMRVQPRGPVHGKVDVILKHEDAVVLCGQSVSHQRRPRQQHAHGPA